jgi:hypothetical protein
MSLDYPFYERPRDAGHPAARWWRVGDVLYYLGILVALLGTPCWLVPVAFWTTLLRSALPGALLTLISGVALTVVGVWTKREAYRRASLDGIVPDHG